MPAPLDDGFHLAPGDVLDVSLFGPHFHRGDIEVVPEAPVLTVRLMDLFIICAFWSSPPQIQKKPASSGK
jgi:hypothetical protein